MTTNVYSPKEQQPLLPPEVLSHIFMHVDPHTLYTSVRALSRAWKATVEEHLLAHQFNTGRWRLGLRIVKRARRGQPWRGGVVGGEGREAPGESWNSYRGAHGGAERQVQSNNGSRPTQGLSAGMLFALGSSSPPGNSTTQTRPFGPLTSSQDESDRQSEEAVRQRFASTNVLSRREAMEAELPFSREEETNGAKGSDPLIHIVPLQFDRYDAENVSMKFTTGLDEWHALFEQQSSSSAEDEEEEGEGRREAEEAKRLDLDFGFVWRFPGDGQDDNPDVGSQGWGRPDPENGWLSRFYCSGYDTKSADTSSATTAPEPEEAKGDRILQSTPLARRRRMATLHRETPSSDFESQDEQLFWSDEGHEYMSLSLSLGAEFFVRRAARTNHLLRRLEVAARSQEEKRSVKGQRQKRNVGAVTPSTCSSTASSTPTRASSPPPPPSRATAVVTARDGNSPCLTPKTKSASGSSPPRRFLNQNHSPLPKPSWAAIAATPPRSGTSSPVPRSGGSSSSSSGPRIAHLMPPSPTKKEMPLPTQEEKDEDVNTSSPSDDQGLFQSIVDSAVSMTSGQTTAVATAQGSNRRSSPRATFVCKLMRPSVSARNNECWSGGDQWGRNASRVLPTSSKLEKVATWEWRR